jgi:hypothetical protein
MKFYVAGKIGDEKRVRRVQVTVLALGHQLTYDWTVVDLDQLPGNRVDNELTLAVRERDAVARADVVMLVPSEDYFTGALIEIGMHLSRGKHLVLLVDRENGIVPPPSIFWRLPNVQFASMDNAGILRAFVNIEGRV